MGYNKPITARIQHSTNKGMKVQDPLLDLGSPNKYAADTSLTSGVENSKFVDINKPMAEGLDSSKKKPEAPAKASKYGAMLAANIEKGMNPTEAGKQAAIDIKKEPKAAAKSLGPKAIGKSYAPQAMAKKYNDFGSYNISKGGKR